MEQKFYAIGQLGIGSLCAAYNYYGSACFFIGASFLTFIQYLANNITNAIKEAANAKN